MELESPFWSLCHNTVLLRWPIKYRSGPSAARITAGPAPAFGVRSGSAGVRKYTTLIDEDFLTKASRSCCCTSRSINAILAAVRICDDSQLEPSLSTAGNKEGTVVRTQPALERHRTSSRLKMPMPTSLALFRGRETHTPFCFKFHSAIHRVFPPMLVAIPHWLLVTRMPIPTSSHPLAEVDSNSPPWVSRIPTKTCTMCSGTLFFTGQATWHIVPAHG